MKTTLSLLVVVALSGAVFGQASHHPAKSSKPTPKFIACPLTGEKVNIADATKHHMYADYKGNRYFFCCGDCPGSFKANPAKYANKPHIKTPVVKKPKKG